MENFSIGDELERVYKVEKFKEEHPLLPSKLIIEWIDKHKRLVLFQNYDKQFHLEFFTKIKKSSSNDIYYEAY